MSRLPRVLFLSPGIEEYLSDGVFHGLRSLLGDLAVDYPKHELMYKTTPATDIRRVRGRGVTLYGLLDDIPVSRARVWDELRRGQFDAVVFADISNRFGAYVELLPYLEGTAVAVLDGADAESLYPYGGHWWRRRPWWLLPRAHVRHLYFKRELTPRTTSYRWYRLLPTALARHVPRPRRILPVSYSVPPEKIVAAAPAKDQVLATQVVDVEVAERLGASTEAPFDDEESYYADLRRSRFAVTTKRGGWDCLRHYEIAANGCVPCFRELDRKPATCAPHGLDETNCVVYHGYDDLMRRIHRIGPDDYAALQAGALAWARANTTVVRARELLTALGIEVPTPSNAPEERIRVPESAGVR